MKRSIQHTGEEKDLHYDPETKAKIRKHLSDINDVITEDDIRNVRIDNLVPPTEEEEQAAEKEADKLVEEQEKEDEQEGNKDGNNSPDVDNDSWNVLNR